MKFVGCLAVQKDQECLALQKGQECLAVQRNPVSLVG